MSKIMNKLPPVTTAAAAEFNDMVRSLVKPGEAILETLTPAKCNVIHMAVGIAGECIEAQGFTDQQNLLEELGDIEFYLAGLLLELLHFDASYRNDYSPSTIRGPLDELVHCGGEVLDMVKKYVIYNKPFVEMEPKIVAALKDLRNALNTVYALHGISREDAINANINKLLKGKNARYSAGSYSDSQAQARADKVNQDRDNSGSMIEAVSAVIPVVAASSATNCSTESYDSGNSSSSCDSGSSD